MGILGKLRSTVDAGFKVLPVAGELTHRQERGLPLGAPFAAREGLPIIALTAGTLAAAAARVLEQSWDVHDA